MSSKFRSFLNFHENSEFKTSNPKLEKVIDSYAFLEISEKNESEIFLSISQNLEESKVIIIDNYKEYEEEKENLYFVVSFKRTILIINEAQIKMLQTLLFSKEKLEICFLSNTKEIFNIINDKFEEEAKVKYKEIKNDENFQEEINEINDRFFKTITNNFPYNDILQKIKSSISGYLIKQSYYANNRIDNFNDKKSEKINPREIMKDEIIELRTIETGSRFQAVLSYHIEYEKLVIIKKCISYNPENEKLLKREIENYEEINHPFIPKFYGTIQYGNLSYPVIEFINGETLLKTDLTQFSETEIIEIILQMLLVINYLHNNSFIYRDLKPNNVIIDENKNLILIDFDRMIKNDDDIETKDFTSYAAPEINSNELNNKCDIYSIGKMIDFIKNNNNSMLKNYNNTIIYQIYNECINDNIETRPKSSELIDLLLQFIINNENINNHKIIYYYSLAANQNITKIQYKLGIIYYKGKYISRDINKSIYYSTLAANQNIPEAQYNLGVIYSEGKYISRDINKSIYYYSLAANQNHIDAQYNLGFIYYSGEYISRDINKSIHYFSLAANQNDPNSQLKLGIIYYEGKYISRDINKSIYYYSLAANQNDLKAQFKLGVIYYEGQYISRDINKSIHYFSLAANQNDPKAQYNLGVIYYKGQYISRDINKSIYYYSLAANQNDPKAQFKLGLIYYEGKYISRDINKSIYYYSLAANHNNPEAQYNLGLIYYKGQYISRDINKSIYYYLLAANQNHVSAQYILGLIYYEGKYISRDINKSIYYYSLAANRNHVSAQYILGLINYEGKYILRDIKKSIHYFTLAANKNHADSQFNLGLIYYEGKYISRDINKSIYYFTLATNQNHIDAQYNLGLIYYEGHIISQDINKAIYYFTLAANQKDPNAQFQLGLIYSDMNDNSHYINKSIYFFSLAANQNHPRAQYILGLIYLDIGIKQNIKRGINLIIQSSNNDCIEADFGLGFLYQEGKYIKRDIKESTRLYKKASSFNHQYAKNNLGIIYKKYYEKKYDYTVYFDEAIRQKNDPVSMYNLSHSYIYEYQDENLLNKSIELLIESSLQDFFPSNELLYIIIIKKFFTKQTNGNIKINNIQQELSKFTKETREIISSIIDIIQEQQLYDQLLFEQLYKKYEENEFIYDMFKKPIRIKDLYNEENEKNLEKSKNENNITNDFYEGFGYDNYQK